MDTLVRYDREHYRRLAAIAAMAELMRTLLATEGSGAVMAAPLIDSVPKTALAVADALLEEAERTEGGR
jgi:hypothetical protein